MSDKEKRNKSGNYNSNGYFLSARKKLGSRLAADPYAYVLFDHMIGWANFEDNELCKRGEIPMGDKDMAERLGWGSPLTVTRKRKKLASMHYIKCRSVRTGPKRGTIVSIVNYDRYQDFRIYENCAIPRSPGDLDHASPRSPGDLDHASPRSPGDLDHASPRSPSDPSILRSYLYDLLLLPAPELATYFEKLPTKKLQKEKAGLDELMKTFDLKQIAGAVAYVTNNKVRTKGEWRECDYPLSYLCHFMDKVLPKISGDTVNASSHLMYCSQCGKVHSGPECATRTQVPC